MEAGEVAADCLAVGLEEGGGEGGEGGWFCGFVVFWWLSWWFGGFGFGLLATQC